MKKLYIILFLILMSIVLNGCSLYIAKKYGTWPYSYDGGKYELPDDEETKESDKVVD